MNELHHSFVQTFDHTSIYLTDLKMLKLSHNLTLLYNSESDYMGSLRIILITMRASFLRNDGYNPGGKLLRNFIKGLMITTIIVCCAVSVRKVPSQNVPVIKFS